MEWISFFVANGQALFPVLCSFAGVDSHTFATRNPSSATTFIWRPATSMTSPTLTRLSILPST
jgi:hypothetical protein